MRTKFVNKLKNQMTMDKIKNKIQLKIINANKTSENKRRWTKSKEKINWRVDMNFCMASTQSRKENEGKERKKEKKSNFGSNHIESPYTCHPERKKTLRQIK